MAKSNPKIIKAGKMSEFLKLKITRYIENCILISYISKEPILKIIYKFYLLSEKVLVQLMIYLITYKIFQLFRASKKLNQGSTHDFLSSQYFCV
jgi:hypothetical protein